MRDPLDAAYVFDQYEAMRREALETYLDGPRGHGLALFLSRGMPAWLAALSVLDGGKASGHAAENFQMTAAPQLPLAVRSELTLVWAGMVLACSREAANELQA